MYKLIIVEDEIKIRNGVVNLFPWNTLHFEVVGDFDDGIKALEYMQDNPVDVVLTDIKMPNMDGFELAGNIREKFGEKIQIVFLTGYYDYEMMRTAICNHAQDYLLKPVQRKGLTECFERIRAKLDEQYGNGSSNEEVPSGYYDAIIHTVKKYIKENTKDCSLEKAASLVGLSPSYLSRVFKEKSGQLFMEYVTKARMEKAAELLKNISYKQYEVAFMVGYDNQQNFSRAFRQYYQMSPSQYRLQNSNGSGLTP